MPSKPRVKKQPLRKVERRTENRSAPTQMMKSYYEMGQSNRRFMRRMGVAVWAFAALLITGALAIRAFTDDTASWPMWAVIFFVLLIGLLLIWPQAAIWAAEKAPRFVVSMLPSKISALWSTAPDRRKESK